MRERGLRAATSCGCPRAGSRRSPRVGSSAPRRARSRRPSSSRCGCSAPRPARRPGPRRRPRRRAPVRRLRPTLHLVRRTCPCGQRPGRRPGRRARAHRRDRRRPRSPAAADRLEGRPPALPRANRAFARAAGLTGAQLAGRSDRELVLRPELCDGGDVARRHEREVLQSGRPQIARIEATQVAAGREQWLAVSRIPLTGSDGKPSGVIVVSEDITDRLQAAAMLRHAERTGAVARLASAMSADLQNPLTEIENLATDERIRSAARNANDLVRQLSAFARRQLADPIDVAPASLIARMGGLLARVLGDGLALDLPVEGLRSAVRVDPRQLELLVVAVVRHIRSYMPQGSKLAIDVAPQTLGIERSLGFGLPAGEYVRIRFLAYPVESGGADMGEALRARLALAQAIARHGGGALRLNRDSESSFRASFDSLAIEVVLPRVFSIPRAVDPTPRPTPAASSRCSSSTTTSTCAGPWAPRCASSATPSTSPSTSTRRWRCSASPGRRRPSP
ncbi:PAS domain-containing protein [Nannocystis pusilla]|uniref:PAS domain-containing protein n=1 Tax=Nannocystis pusilla TaxID=889268 RepID=UPI003B80DC4C